MSEGYNGAYTGQQIDAAVGAVRELTGQLQQAAAFARATGSGGKELNRMLQNAAAVFFDTCLTLSYNPRLVVKVCFYLTICETADFAVNYRSKGE